MIAPQVINLTMAAGAGGGVTDNKQVSATRLNVRKVILSTPTTNGGNIRVGHSVVTNMGITANDGSFTAPTSPLTDVTAIQIMTPGTVWIAEVPVQQAGIGEQYDLQRWYVQGTVNDQIKFTYEVRIDL